MDKSYKYDLCERFNCKPSELAENLAAECYDVRDALDCSLYPECYEVDGESWYFESVGGGQHDSRKDGMEIYTSQNIYDELHRLWDKYHLKKVDKDVIAQVENLFKMCEDIQEHEKEWIVDYADNFGLDAVKDTYNRAFNEWKNNYKYLTEFVMVLNWKIAEHYGSNEAYTEVYTELFHKANDYALENLKGEELQYFYRVTD